MDTFLYTSDIDGIHNRIDRVLCGGPTDVLPISGNDNLDYSDFATSIGDNGSEHTNNKNTIVTEYEEIGEIIIGNNDSDNDNDNNNNVGGDILKKKYEKMSASEMRLCEMEMVKYKQMLSQHKYERGYRKKASILERELNSKTIVRECNSLAEFAKALDVSHSKWMRCAKKTKEKYIKEYVYRKHGIPVEKKSRKGGSGKKTKKSAFNVASINLNNCESGAEPNICVKTTGGVAKNTKEKIDKIDKKNKNKKKIEITEEISKELETYLQNLTNEMYDDPENITYDHKKKRIEKLAMKL